MSRPIATYVSVIIPNYNGKVYLGECLGSLAGQDYPSDRFEVIVVDNASSDGSTAYLKENFPDVRVVESSENLGFAGGCNLGIEASKGEFVVMLNNDTSTDVGWLSELVRTARNDASIGIVTSKILFKDRPDIINNAGSVVYRSGSGGDRGFGERDEGQYDREEEVFCACGASMLLRKAMIADIGAFDPDFFCYSEDTDLSWRARLMGWKVVYNYRSVVYHVHAASSTEWSEFFTYHVLRNRMYMLIKNAWPGIIIASLARFVATTLFSILVSPLRTRLFDNGHYFDILVRLKVAAALVRDITVLLEKRRAIRGAAKVDDNKIKAWLV